MDDCAQVHAQIPRRLKKQAFIVLAEQERKFSSWLRQELEKLLEQAPQGGEKHGGDERE